MISRTGDRIVSPHRDWIGDDFDPRRTQVTLFLSKRGVDYSGDGFVFQTNRGARIVFDRDVVVNPGDLVIWRHNNEHAVLNVTSRPGQVGFVRILLPPEKVYPSRLVPLNQIPGRLKARLRQNRFVARHVLPVYRRLCGRL